jgi:hypothetical protein
MVKVSAPALSFPTMGALALGANILPSHEPVLRVRLCFQRAQDEARVGRTATELLCRKGVVCVARWSDQVGIHRKLREARRIAQGGFSRSLEENDWFGWQRQRGTRGVLFVAQHVIEER